MTISRRQVLKWIAATAAAGPLLPALEGLARAVAEQPGASPLLWFNDNGDHQNFLAQLGHEMPSLLERIAGDWNLTRYEPLVPEAPLPTPERYASAPILILETLPSAPGGQDLAALIGQAKAVILLGTDACFGGMRWSPDRAESVKTLCGRSRTPLLRLPGVPAPPHHLIGTLSHLELLGFPQVDRFGRPLLYYGETVCKRCERRGELENGLFARSFADPGCLLELGCKGPITHNSCAVHRWNGGTNWCVGAGGPCTGCAEPGYPNHAGLGLYGRLPGDRLSARSPFLTHIRAIGWGLVGLAGLGVGLRLLLSAIDPFDRMGARRNRQRVSEQRTGRP
jgi:hydrogenase small subunit